ncbi:MAG: MbcA/ParS/Xre antitoxin family protein [Candidatus Thiodiazotropha sp. (ex Dulcina madagascariensis)]|nr:MbcA/ParS/Xre antitoxin family protein [Candidatus Thiodiazotropha sp. (ex Dulcina madagascariensis)]MCU7934511.1 MbcA/ParS/Xre antitoxin family protein [Candidatus Thiodiazotropha sp. (ex Dulcina madagascariensis)]
MANSDVVSKANKSAVLGEAVLNAGAKLGMSPEEVGRVVGRNRTTITRNGINPATPNGQLALLLVRIYRGLYVLVGGRDDEMSHWMHTRIRTLQGVPAEMIHDVSGLVRVVEYIDAMRGKA